MGVIAHLQDDEFVVVDALREPVGIDQEIRGGMGLQGQPGQQKKPQKQGAGRDAAKEVRHGNSWIRVAGGR
jgi:hypothetical protein